MSRRRTQQVIDTAGARTAFAEATSPCAACPWRTANHGKRHTDGWYTQANRRRLWAGLRNGERMTCHPTDPANPLPDGARPVPEGTTTKECAGALILIQREGQRLGDVLAADGTFADYRKAHPKGLTREGMFSLMASMAVTWPGELPMARPNLNDDSVSHPDLVPWETRT